MLLSEFSNDLGCAIGVDTSLIVGHGNEVGSELAIASYYNCLDL